MTPKVIPFKRKIRHSKESLKWDAIQKEYFPEGKETLIPVGGSND